MFVRVADIVIKTFMLPKLTLPVEQQIGGSRRMAFERMQNSCQRIIVFASGRNRQGREHQMNVICHDAKGIQPVHPSCAVMDAVRHQPGDARIFQPQRPGFGCVQATLQVTKAAAKSLQLELFALRFTAFG